MLIRNKKTGEIYKIEDIDLGNNADGIWLGMTKYTSLAKLNEEWEDYEEPKEYWFINDLDREPMKCELRHCSVRSFTEWGKKRKQIGNYFETREEAEKAVEKLKAWKRLKDNGFRFIDWELDMKTVADGKIWFDVGTNTEWDAERLLELKPEVKESLDLLFGGEE